MTLDRDIRFTPNEIIVMQRALKAEIRKHARSISKAEDLRSKGATIQHGTLDWHYKELQTASAALEALNVAQRQIQYRMREKLGLA